MIRVNQVKLPVSHSEADLRKKTAKMMGVSADQIQSVELVRQSLDARKKPDLYYLYALDVAVAGKEAAIVKRARSVNVQIRKEEAYRLPDPGIEPLRERPVIVGFGPAGMFCGLMLARAGYRPLILERGLDADSVQRRLHAIGQMERWIRSAMCSSARAVPVRFQMES